LRRRVGRPQLKRDPLGAQRGSGVYFSDRLKTPW